MNLTILEKIKTLFSFMFSSFLSIELLIFSILLFAILLVNMRRKDKVVTYSIIGIYLGLLLGTMIAYSEYVVICFRTFFKTIVSYICFPTTAAFFFSMVFITVILVNTLISKKISKFKSIVNYLFFSVIYFLFMAFIVISAYSGVDISSNVELYTNDFILVTAQFSNLLIIIWSVFTIFYKLYGKFKKFD